MGEGLGGLLFPMPAGGRLGVQRPLRCCRQETCLACLGKLHCNVSFCLSVSTSWGCGLLNISSWPAAACSSQAKSQACCWPLTLAPPCPAEPLFLLWVELAEVIFSEPLPHTPHWASRHQPSASSSSQGVWGEEARETALLEIRVSPTSIDFVPGTHSAGTPGVRNEKDTVCPDGAYGRKETDSNVTAIANSY